MIWQKNCQEAIRQGKTAKVHIKIDTGMSRLGFCDSNESIGIIKEIASLAGLIYRRNILTFCKSR